MFARFQREINIVGRLSHPNIVQIIDAGQTSDGTTYLIMELLRGRRLGDFVPSGGLPRAQALELFKQLCNGVEAAHTQGLIHRDLSPGNVYVHELNSGQTQAKILDFGLAKALEFDGPAITGDNHIVGTPGFMAPEQIDHSHPVDEYTDVYGLGALLYLMLSGRPAFAGGFAGAVVSNQLEGKRRPLGPAHASLETLIDRALARAPSDRPTSVKELLRELTAIETGAGKSPVVTALESTLEADGPD